MRSAGRVVASARKPSAFFRAFEVELPGRRFELKAVSVWGREFGLYEGETLIGRIGPASWLGRSAVIDLPDALPTEAQVFLFWLVLVLRKRAARIKVLLMDVDGTMTDGGVTLLSQNDGTALEIKTFDAHDGQGLTLAHTAGLRTGCITGRESSALLRRAREMKMEFIYMKQPVKMPAYEEILQKTGVSDSAVAVIGDDLPDLPLMRRAGLAVAVGDAVPEVKQVAHYVTRAPAGHGAIREAVELVLKAKGIWTEMIDKARA